MPQGDAGAPGTPGTPGAAGVAGVAGVAGPPGSGGNYTCNTDDLEWAINEMDRKQNAKLDLLLNRLAELTDTVDTVLATATNITTWLATTYTEAVDFIEGDADTIKDSIEAAFSCLIGKATSDAAGNEQACALFAR